MKNSIQLFFLFALLIASDQFSKVLFSENSVCNKNIAWSVPIAPGVFYFFWMIIFVILIYSFLKSRRPAEKLALVFILSGAVSNIIDRLARGCVIDFIDLKIWPVFNLADIYITIGIMLLIVIYVKYKIPDTKY
ncbi:MAG: signal peptidase II [Candidatus Moranbacteria bacterium]|nr:signal peptidase II [Candidatus Moranbacteria bacterium]